ncbi:MAG TPA: FAD:protein FMN transferase, partial [Thiobacillaceae bacterium]|nr:FAD:protein FMN transferase [Thiobacillaceae bacterium]
TVSPHTWQVILHAQTVAAASNGVFDPTVAPALVASGALPAPTGPRPDPEATWADIALLDEQRVAFRRPLWLDLGGIAKGYAVDRAVQELGQYGATRGLVNAGGDLRVFGRDETRVPIAVRHPAQPTHTLTLGSLAQGAVASSGDYFAATAQAQISPIVAPGQGVRPANGSAVVVVASECWCADALTKVVSLMDAASTPVLRTFNATAARLDTHGTLRAMPGFMERLGQTTPETQSPHA